MQRLFISRYDHRAHLQQNLRRQAQNARLIRWQALGGCRQQSQKTNHGERIEEPKGYPGNGRVLQIAGAGALICASLAYYLSSSSKPAGNHFVPYELLAKRTVSPTSAVFELRPEKRHSGIKSQGGLYEGYIWSVNVAQPQLQIQRAYTPLPWPEPKGASSAPAPEGNDMLRLLIRREPQGEVSSYLHKLEASGSPSQVLISGPHLHYSIPKDVEEIVFIAGGTGIAPALQIAQDLGTLREDGRTPAMHILWANRKREDCLGGFNDRTSVKLEGNSIYSWLGFSSPASAASIPAQALSRAFSNDRSSPIVQQLEQLKNCHSKKLSVDYFVDDEHRSIDMSTLRIRLVSSKPTIADRGFHTPSSAPPSVALPGRRILFVAGPDAFVAHLAGPKAWRQGQEEQGQLGGLLKQLNPKGWDVWKL